jgi:hypothetical protein
MLMVWCQDSEPDDERDQEPDEAPETPLDEPRPPRVQDPPPQPDQKGPYVVRSESAPASVNGGIER